jgi:hypothetical protein
VRECGLDSSGSRYDLAVRSSEHRNERVVAQNTGNFVTSEE